jgi:hypothetical protein
MEEKKESLASRHRCKTVEGDKKVFCYDGTGRVCTSADRKNREVSEFLMSARKYAEHRRVTWLCDVFINILLYCKK